MKSIHHDIDDAGAKKRRSATAVEQPFLSAGGAAVGLESARPVWTKTSGDCPVTASRGSVRNVAIRTAWATSEDGSAYTHIYDGEFRISLTCLKRLM